MKQERAIIAEKPKGNERVIDGEKPRRFERAMSLEKTNCHKRKRQGQAGALILPIKKNKVSLASQNKTAYSMINAEIIT